MNTQTRKIVTTIPAREPTVRNGLAPGKRRHVACYSRVSTDELLQLSSLEAQRSALPDFIRARSDWILAGEYFDEGISGTSTRHRDGFNRMISDALAGNFSLIVTKSISRFARNTVDSLTTIRLLKEHGVEIYFQKENIWTFDSKGEVMLTIMSSLSQEESRSISENVKWGLRKRFADGVYWVPYKNFLGYDRGPNGEMVVNREQAETVREIYSMFLRGYTYAGICRAMDGRGVPPPGGGKGWSSAYVRKLLTNIKYKGDNLSQQGYIEDYLTHRYVKNNGQLPMYYTEGGHEAIIDPVTFELVQEEIGRRGQSVKGRDTLRPFSGRLRCAECGHWYGSRSSRSSSCIEQHLWSCPGRREQQCRTPTFTESLLKGAAFVAMNELLSQKEQRLGEIDAALAAIAEREAALSLKLRALCAEQERRQAEMRRLLLGSGERARERYEDLAHDCAAADRALTALSGEQEELKRRRFRMTRFRDSLERQAPPEEFSEGAFQALFDFGTAYRDDRIVWTFLDGGKLTADV